MDSSSSTDKVTTWGVGKSGTASNVYLEYKLKRIKRSNGGIVGKDLTYAVIPNSLRWNFKQIGSTTADKFYLFAQSSQIKTQETPAPKTEHNVYHVVIAPRHTADSTQIKITKANAEVITNTNFIEHDICLTESKTKDTHTNCQTPTVALPENQASFFMQVVSVANHDAAGYDKVKYESVYTVTNECDDTTKIMKCYNW